MSRVAQPEWRLSGIISCDSDTDSNCAMQTACETSKTQTLRNKGPVFSPTSPVGSQESVLKLPKRGQFHATVRVPKEH